MSTTHRRWSVATSIVLAAGAMVFVACGGEKQAQPMARPPPPAESPGSTNMQPESLPPNTRTASNIAISEEVLRACNIPDANAYFAFDSARLTEFDHSALDQVATCFARGPMAGRKLKLVGHADPRGADDYNMLLGQSRADAVGSFLTTHGMSRGNVATTSRGAMDATGQEETGWAHDRRVDVLLAK